MAEKEVTVKIKYQTVGKEKAKQSEKSIKDLGKQTKATTNTMGKDLKGLGYNLTFIAWHFRYLGNIFQQVSKQMMRFMKDIINTGVELEESFFSIRAAAALYGQEAEKATAATWGLAEKGLVPLTDAASITRNLLMTGLGVPEMEEFMYRYLDVAALTTSGMGEMSKSLELMSTSILRGTTVLATDRTARMVWSMTNKRLQETLGLTLKELDKQRAAMEILITINREFAGTEGLHRAEMEMTQATLLRMTTAWQSLQYILAEGFKPIIIFIADVILKVTSFVKSLIETLGPVVPIFLAVNTAIITVSASLFFLLGVILSFVKITATATKMLAEMSVAQMAAGNAAAGHALKITLLSGAMKALSLAVRFVIPILLLFDAIAMAVAYTTMKGTGAFEKQTEATKKIEEQIKKVSNALKEFGNVQEEVVGEAEEMDEGRRVAHQRRVEDITEDLDRERSKGLWANQMSIKDLEKRLKREDEDWKRYQAGLVAGELGATKVEKTELEKRLDRYAEQIALIKRMTDEQLEGLKWSWGKFIEDLTSAAFWAKWFRMWKEMPGKIWNILSAELPDVFYNTWKIMVFWFQNQWNELTRIMGEGVDEFYLIAKAMARGFEEAFLPDITSWFRNQWDELMTLIQDGIRELRERLSWGNLFGFWGSQLGKFGEMKFPWEGQFGGIVPGPIGQPVPIIAHGGERVVPSRESAQGNITVNINSPVVRETQDIQRIADAVKTALGQRARWASLGGY